MSLLDEQLPAKPYVVWDAKGDRVGSYAEKGDANRAMRNAGPGACLVRAGAILSHHPSSSDRHEKAQHARAKEGRFVETAPDAPAPPVPSATEEPCPEVEVRAKVRPEEPAAPSPPRCTVPGCTDLRGQIRSNTRPEHAPFCPVHRKVALDRDSKAARTGKTAPSLLDLPPQARSGPRQPTAPRRGGEPSTLDARLAALDTEAAAIRTALETRATDLRAELATIAAQLARLPRGAS